MLGARPLIVCWGELVWDLFPLDDAGAPRFVLGGTAAATAAQLAARGARARLVSAVGSDALGAAAIGELEKRGVDGRLVALPGAESACVSILVDDTGEPHYEPKHRFDWAAIDFTDALASALDDAKALTFSVFAQHQQLELGGLEAACSRAALQLVACDLNLRRPTPASLLRRVAKLSHVIKLNAREYELTRAALGGAEPSDWFFTHGRCELVALTRGPLGAELRTPSGVIAHPGAAQGYVRDSVGAGDAFLAAFVLASLDGVALRTRLQRAVTAAEEQLALRGAMPRSTSSE